MPARRRLDQRKQSPSAGALRKRRARQRDKLGLKPVTAELTYDVFIEAAIVSGQLSEAEALDKSKVARLLGRVGDEWARRWLCG